MNTMRFNVKVVRDFLITNGYVYTVRKYHYSVYYAWCPDINRAVTRLFCAEIHTEKDLEPYLNGSGFKTINDWWYRILEFIPENRTKYLYQVKVVK